MIRRMPERRIRRLILCHECWHWNEINKHSGRCMKQIILTKPDFFCGYGHN